jgi:hypothetical protein
MFTDVNVAGLVAWFITGLVMFFSGSYFMSKWKFRKYYHYLQIHAGGLFRFPRNGFGVIWMLIAGSQIAAMVLWTMNYQFCDNTYYVTVVALALAEFLFISMWAPLFVRMNRPGAAAFVVFLTLAAGGIAVGLMAGTVVRNNAGCTFDAAGSKTPGILACILWGWPLLWFLVVFFMTLRVARAHKLTYKHWLHHHLIPFLRKERKFINYDDEEHARHHRTHRRRRSYDSYYGTGNASSSSSHDSEIGQPLKQRSANLRPL